MIAALFVEKDGCYFGVEGVDPWDAERDARNYHGMSPVVAHPPCHLWVNMAAVNYKRGRATPAWYPGGDDGGCFRHALAMVRLCGGVLEHPAESHAWDVFDLLEPRPGRWRGFWSSSGVRFTHNWVCEVWQSAYGHRARKRTWLLYAGDRPPPDLNWSRSPGTHQIGWFDRKKPPLSKRDANATPPEFRDVLIGLARHSRAEWRAA